MVDAIVLPEPEDHTDDCDRVLTMARMSIDEVLELSEDEFGMYVMDQWPWKSAFTRTTTMYTEARNEHARRGCERELDHRPVLDRWRDLEVRTAGPRTFRGCALPFS